MKYLLLLLLALPAMGATTFYVDYAGGSDANNGTATGTPWKHIPGDPSASGTPAAATGVTGTIYLKGGVTYGLSTLDGLTLDVTHYNIAGPLTITSGTNVTWGSGTSAIDGAGVAGVLMYSQINYLTLRGLNMGNTIDPTGTGQDGAIVIYGAVSNIIDTCTIHDIGTNNANCHVTGVELNNASQFASFHTITNCLIYKCTQKCFETFRCDSNNVVNSVFHDASDHCGVVQSDGNKVHGNVFSNACVTVWLRSGAAPGSAFKFSIGNSPITTHGNMFYNNIVAHCNGNGAGVKLDNGQSGSTDNLGDGNMIFNNTFFDIANTSDCYGIIVFDCRTAKINGTLIMNNIVTAQIAGGTCASWTTPLMFTAPSYNGITIGNNNIVAYNLFFDANASTHPGNWVSGVQSSPTWANFSDTGSTSPDRRFTNPVNGTGNSFVFGNQFFDTDPKFISYPSDLRLLQTSPAATTGTNLSAYFTSDFTGRTRTSWSMGAFDFTPLLPAVVNVNAIFSGKASGQ